MTYKAIIIFDNVSNSVQEVILVPENAVKSVMNAVSEKTGWVVCKDTVVCKSVKDLESKSVLFKS